MDQRSDIRSSVTGEESSSSHNRDGAASSLGKQPPRPPDLDLLATGVAIYPGGRTRHGTPIIVFPAKGHLRLQTGSVSDAQLVDIVKFFVSITSPSRRMKGFAFLADFRASTPSVFTIIVSAMCTLQRAHTGLISVFYILMPRHKPLQKALYKAMGIHRKRSFFSFGKRKKQDSPVSNLPHILLHSAVELHEHVAEDQLPADFAGSLRYSHPDWIHFYKLMQANVDAVRQIERRMPETEDRLRELQDAPLPADPTAAEETLGRMRSVYEDAVEYLGVNEAVDETTHLLGICAAPERHASFMGLEGNPHWREYHAILTALMERLLEQRRFLQGLWKDASSRVEYARQFGEYKRQTGESLKWIQDVGQPILRHPLKVAENLDEAESNRRTFMDQVYRPAQSALQNADRCVNKTDGLTQVVANADVDGPVHFTQDTTRFLDAFRSQLEQRRKDYDNLYNFYLTVGRLVRWYRRTLRHLPTHLAPTPRDADDPSAPAPLGPQWERALRSYALRHPAPNADQLSRVRDSLALLPATPIKNQARLLLHRLQLLVALIEGRATVREFREVLDLRRRCQKGLHDGALRATPAASLSSLLRLGRGDSGVSDFPTMSPAPPRGRKGQPALRRGFPVVESDTSSAELVAVAAMRETSARCGSDLLPRLREDSVERFLSEQTPRRLVTSEESAGGYSAPAEDILAMDHFNLARAHSEQDFPSRASLVPPSALYRPVSLAAMALGGPGSAWDASIRQEERRQQELMRREMQRRKDLLADAERSVRDSSSYLTEMERDSEPRPARRKERRGVRSVKKKDSRKAPAHHSSVPNIHYDWDDPDLGEDEADAEAWADNERSLSELETLLNTLADDGPPGLTELLPDTHIGAPGAAAEPSVLAPPMRVRRYERDTPSGLSSMGSGGTPALGGGGGRAEATTTLPLPARRRYPPFSQQRDDVMLF